MKFMHAAQSWVLTGVIRNRAGESGSEVRMTTGLSFPVYLTLRFPLSKAAQDIQQEPAVQRNGEVIPSMFSRPNFVPDLSYVSRTG